MKKNLWNYWKKIIIQKYLILYKKYNEIKNQGHNMVI